MTSIIQGLINYGTIILFLYTLCIILHLYRYYSILDYTMRSLFRFALNSQVT